MLVNQCEFLQINVNVAHPQMVLCLPLRIIGVSQVLIYSDRRAKSLEVLSRGFAAREFGQQRSIHPERENKPLGTLGSDKKKLANLFASLFYQISEELRQILTSVPRARTNEGLKKVTKTRQKLCSSSIAITT